MVAHPGRATIPQVALTWLLARRPGHDEPVSCHLEAPPACGRKAPLSGMIFISGLLHGT